MQGNAIHNENDHVHQQRREDEHSSHKEQRLRSEQGLPGNRSRKPERRRSHQRIAQDQQRHDDKEQQEFELWRKIGERSGKAPERRVIRGTDAG